MRTQLPSRKCRTWIRSRRRGVLFTNYYAVAHPSYPNYLALVSGHTFIDDEKAQPDPEAYNRREFGDAQLLIDAPTVADGLEAQHTSWNAFAEDYPVPIGHRRVAISRAGPVRMLESTSRS
jgi:Phosphoesterase family.